MSRLIEFVPIITTLFSIYFFREIYSHYLIRKTKYLLWWSIGVLTFGMGTSAESINAIFGWNEINLKYWYIVGALLGGFPLAQGTVYLLMKKRFADITSLILVIIIAIASIFVILTPLTIPADFRYKLTGSVFAWQWVRYFSPFVNLYASVFLIGGAVYSAIRYYKQTEKEARFIGNIYIALGGLLPGIGGSFTRMGYVNVLFITELTGLLLIYYGYRIIKLDKRRYKSDTQKSV
jgi:hypothetical protein